MVTLSSRPLSGQQMAGPRPCTQPYDAFQGSVLGSRGSVSKSISDVICMVV